MQKTEGKRQIMANNTGLTCPLLDSQIREDMVLCALDALRRDGEPITPDQLRERYGFAENSVLLYGESAIYQANRDFHKPRKEPSP